MNKLDFLRHLLEQAFIQKKLESIDLIATNGSKNINLKVTFLTTPTKEPKLNHWVNTQCNQLVIEFIPPIDVFKKYFKFYIFLDI